MTHTIDGSCHCGNLRFKLVTQVNPAEIQARACDCSFCRQHGTRNWSDSNGTVTIRVRDPQQLQKYRFGLKTVDFYICQVCGIYLGAVLTDADGIWSTVNFRLTDLTVDERTVSYGNEDVSSRVARRKRRWTPTTVET